MGMCQKHIVYQCRINRQFTVLKHLDTLLHTIINQNIFFSYTKIMATARNLMIGPNKHQFHRYFPPNYSYHIIFYGLRKSFLSSPYNKVKSR